MSTVTVRGLIKHFDGKPPTTAVDDLSLDIADGEFLVLLGPSGCGKTTTLRCLAGLETPHAGTISFGDETVFDDSRGLNRSPDKRSIGMVFQSYSLWPHLTVRANIAYPLKARRVTVGLRGGWVEETAALVDCTALLDRYPSQLSGGQQQRVALARGIVARPDLVLFDEPLSNLDARLRDQVRGELHELHQRLRFTSVFVTHDQSEALALGDRLAIMRSGHIDQLGTPDEVYEQPRTEYVAAFVGMRNRLVAEHQDGVWRVARHVPRGAAPVSAPVSSGANAQRVAVRLRPEDLRVIPTDVVPDGCSVLDARLVGVEYGGHLLDVTVEFAGSRLLARVPTGAGAFVRGLDPGAPISLAFVPSDARCFDADDVAAVP